MSAEPRQPREPRCPRAGKDSLWALGPRPGRTSSAGRKKLEPKPRRRSREAGAGQPWPGRAVDGGGPGYAARSRQKTPVPPGSPRRLPPLPVAGRGRLPAPHRGPERARRISVAASAPGPRTLRPGPEQPSASRGGTQRRGRAGGGGERAAARPYKERPGEGAGRGGEGGRGRKLPQEGAPILPRGRRLHQGPPAPAPNPLPPAPAAAPARPRPPLPKHRPLMSFPDLPRRPRSTRGCPGSDSLSPLRAKPPEVRRVPQRYRNRRVAPPLRPTPLPLQACCYPPSPPPSSFSSTSPPKSPPGQPGLGSRVGGDVERGVRFCPRPPRPFCDPGDGGVGCEQEP